MKERNKKERQKRGKEQDKKEIEKWSKKEKK